MASEAGRITEPTRSGNVPAAIALVAIVVVCVIVWASLTLAGGQEVPNPLTAPIMVATGKLTWSTAATVWAVAMVVVIGGVAAAGWWVWQSRRPDRTRVDHAQRHLGNGKEITSIRKETVAAKARSLGVTEANRIAPFTSWEGVPIGKVVGTNDYVMASWEDMHLDIWGPRQGKSTSRIIPAICEAPGAVLATENKRGNLDHTRRVREFPDENGNPTRRVWVFDPQGVANEEPSWYWDPCTYVTGENQADELAALFAMGDDGQDVKKDAYFDPEGQDLVASLILASALAGEEITMVYERIAEPSQCRQAVQILEDHDYPLIARGLNAKVNLSDKQKDGIFGTALKMVRCLRNRDIQKWITEPEGGTRPQLDLETYIRNGETLYALSKEGVGSAGPLVAALTVAATRTAEAIASRSPGGRLRVPMLCALDEAANVVRWPDLPKLYSHFGSRGIIIMTILQSWSQGIGCFGERSMKLLESSSNVYVYGGNVREAEGYLGQLVKLAGEYERQAINVSRSPSQKGASTSVHTTKESVFTVADLAAWPRGRALVLSAGNRPVIVETVPWWTKPYAPLIEESLRMYSPADDEKEAS